MHFLQAIKSDISVLIVCNKTGGTIKGDIKKKYFCIDPLKTNGRLLQLDQSVRRSRHFLLGYKNKFMM